MENSENKNNQKQSKTIKNNQNKFTFFLNFKETADRLPDDSRLKFYDALTNYVFLGIETDDVLIGALINALKPSLDKVEKRGGFRDGAGRPKQNQNKSKIIKNNQTESNNNQKNQSFQKIEEKEKENSFSSIVDNNIYISPHTHTREGEDFYVEW